jgi:Leucine-rich repeat (LRR) protein
MKLVVGLLVLVELSWGITNNADLIWYDRETGEPHNYVAREPTPEGLLQTEKIVVNQKFSILWEVKFAFFDNLEALMIDDCGINEIKPNTFRDLKPLTNLSLTFNHIREIKEGVFNFVQVKNLNFSHNRLAIIGARAFDNMQALETITLDFNELKNWNGDWFFNCSRLATVSLTHNFLEEIPANAFKNFWKDRDTVNIYLSYNKIETVDRDAFAEVGKFGDLFLDWNDLPRVDGHIFGKLTSVEHLNLNGDSLRCLSEEFIGNVLNKTNLVSVQGNPFKCECLKELRNREGRIRARVELSQEQTVDC